MIKRNILLAIIGICILGKADAQSLNTIMGNGNSTDYFLRLKGTTDIGNSGSGELVLGRITAPITSDTRAFIGWKHENIITNGLAGTLLLQGRSDIANVPIDFVTGQGTPQLRMRVMGNGTSTRVGVGGGTPKGILDVAGDPSGSGNEMYLTGQTTANQNSNSLRLNFVGIDQKAGFGIQAENVAPYGKKDLVFYGHNANDYTSYNEVVRFKYNGDVGIGTTSPQSKLDVNGNIFSNGKIFIGTADGNTASKIAPYSLAVDGHAIFTKAIVKLSSTWPDYVFGPDYPVVTTDSLERFINMYGHLPEIPKAAEVETNGIDLGGMQALLLKKIEELTLIIIEQEKRIKALEEK